MSNNELYEDEDGTARAHVCRDAERRWVVETNLADTGGLSQYGFAVALTRGAAIAQSIADAQTKWEAEGTNTRL